MSADIITTGIKELDTKLKALPEKVQKKIARAALGQGMTILRKAIIKEAPVGPTGNLKQSIGKRFKRLKKEGYTEAKVGINVGKRKAGMAKMTRAPHGHLVALGTQQRQTKSGANRGVMPANDFVKRATASCENAVVDKIITVIRKKLDAEVAKK